MADQTFNSSYSFGGSGGTAGACCYFCFGVGVNSGNALDFGPNGATLSLDSMGTGPSTSGTYGGALRLRKSGSSSVYGYTVSGLPNFSSGSGQSVAVFIAFNQIVTAASNIEYLLSNSSTTLGSGIPSIAFSGSVGSGLEPYLNISTSNHLSSGQDFSTGVAHSMCAVSTYGNNFTFYVDGSSVATGSNSGYGGTAQNIGRFGGVNGDGYIEMDIFVIAYFVASSTSDVLNATDVSNLHSSLTGGNAFALWTLPPPPVVPPSQFFLGAAPLAGLSWMIDRRNRVPQEEKSWRQDKHSRLFLPTWFRR